MTDAPAPDPPAEAPGSDAPARPRGRWDRAGVWVAWGVIFVCVSFVLFVSWRAKRQRPELTEGPFERDPLEGVEAVKPPPAPTGRVAEALRDPEKFPSSPLKTAARQAIGLRDAFGPVAPPTTQPAPSTRPSAAQRQQFSQQVRKAAAASVLDGFRAVPVIAELEGIDAALAELDRLNIGPDHPLGRDAESLRSIYSMGPDSLDRAARAELVRRHGWFAKLALSFGKAPDHPDRIEAVAPARRAGWVVLGLFCTVALTGLAGLILLVLAIIRFVNGQLRLAYSGYARTPAAPAPPPYWQMGYVLPPPPVPYPPAGYPPAWHGGYPYPTPRPYGYPPPYPQPYAFQPLPPPPTAAAPAPDAVPDRLASPRTGPFLEAFAIYLASQILLSLLVHLVFPNKASVEMEWLMLAMLPVIFLWPVWRGVRWGDVRRAFGWHAGRGVFREVGAGVVGYVTGFPVFFACAMVSALLMHLTGADASHPMQFEVGKSLKGNLQLYLLACVWAPVVEETMFRGALFHHLRRRWNWLLSAGFSALIFAAVHPQGWTAIPVLGGLAVIFAAVREWRGSAIAPMTGHFIQNFTVTTMLILMAA